MIHQSDEIGQLAAALVAAQGEFAAVDKTARNPFYNSTYAPLPEVVKAVQPILAAHDLAVVQFIGYTVEDMLTTRIVHASGEWLESTCRLEVRRFDQEGTEKPPTMQNVGAAITYMRRMALMSALGLVADEDDDGNTGAGGPPARGGGARKREPMSVAQADRLDRDRAAKNLTGEAFYTWAGGVLGRDDITSLSDIGKSEASRLIEALATYSNEADDVPF